MNPVPGGEDRPPLVERRLGAQAGEIAPVREVSRALARLWGGGAAPGERKIIRACQGNLIVWAGDSTDGSFERMLEEMARIRPVRIILLQPAPVETPMLARISAVRNLRGSRERVCCEKIALPLSAGTEELAAGATRSLLRGDVPVLLWCPAEPPFGLAAFVDLCGDVDSLLVDSAKFERSFEGLRRLIDLRQSASRLHLLDWAWRRLGEWRRAVATGFDPPAARARIPELRGLTIELTAVRPPGIPAGAILLAGWIAGVLRRFDLALVVREGTAQAARSGRIRRLEFAFSSGPPLGIALAPGPENEANLPADLAGFLGQRAGDRAYEEALAAGAAMEGAFGGEA